MGAALGGVLLVAGTSCIRITIITPGPQAGPARLGGSGDVRNSGGYQVPDDTGGVFAPVQAARLTGGQATVCGNPVSGTYVRFSNPYLTQTPDAAVTGFRGTVVNTNTGQIIPNTQYYLQWFVNALPQNNGCCTNAGTTEVGFKVTAAALPHRFTAFFKTGNEPPSGHQIRLQGSWTQ